MIYSPEVTNVLGAVTGRRNVETQAHLATVLSLAEALDQRDSGTAKHSQTVGRLCEMMAQRARIRARIASSASGSPGSSTTSARSAFPTRSSASQARLTSEEMDQMRRHPELGRPDALQQ